MSPGRLIGKRWGSYRRKSSCGCDGCSHMDFEVVWMQPETLLCMELPSSLDWSLCQMDQWKCVLWSEESMCRLQENRCQVLNAKNEKDHPDYYWQKMQKPASVMVCWCISSHGTGDLHMYEGTINTEAYIGILGTYAAIKMSSCQWIAWGLPEQCQTSFCTCYQSVASQTDCMCLTGRPAVQICVLLKLYDTS